MQALRGRVGWIAALALLIALAAALWFALQSRETRQRPTPAPTAAAPQRAASPAPQASAAAPAAPQPVVDIFAVRTWQPPAPPPMAQAPAAAPPPEAPPLPFRFLGRIIEPGTAPLFLLAQGDQVLAVNVGNTINPSYRLEKYENGELYFLYRPMNVRQSLAVGDAS